MMASLTPSRTSVTAAQRTRIITGLVGLVGAVGLAILGVWPSAIGLALGTVVGAGVVGHRFTPSDLPRDRTRRATRFVARTHRAVWRIVGVGVALVLVGIRLWPIQILGVFWLASWATTLPIAVVGAKGAY